MRTVVFALVLAQAGCHKKPSIEQLTKIREQACACPDQACAEKIDKQMVDMLGDVQDEKDLDDKETAVLVDIAMCLARQGVH